MVEFTDDDHSEPDLVAFSDQRQEQETLTAFYKAANLESSGAITLYSLPISAEASVSRPKRISSNILLRSLLSGLALMTVGFLVGFYTQTSLLTAPEPSEVSIVSGPLPTPVAIGPEGMVQGMEPKLRIERVPGATHYVYSIFNLLSRQNVVYENSSEPFLITPRNALCPNARYAWKAKAFRGAEESSFSSNMEFSIDSDDPDTRKYADQDTGVTPSWWIPSRLT